ncbi:hypothetical protein D3C78_67240 [compost metagenome]
MIKSIQNIRVFLSSPSDVQIERSKVFKIADELNKNMSQVLGQRLEIVGWEEVVPSISRYAQNVINEQIGEYDIFLGILSIRFGTPTPNAGSGTEEEFNLAYDRYKQGKLADICFFFKTDGFTANDIDIDQFTLVKEFKRKISEIGCYRSEIKGDDFDNNIRNLLTTILIDWDRISNRQELGLSKDSISLQLHNIDEDIGYYDAISLSIDELEKSTQITTIFTKAGLIFNEAMLKTKSKLDLCSTDKEKSKIINIFSEDVDAFSLVLEANIDKQRSYLVNSMNYFNIASSIYAEDFNDENDVLNGVFSHIEEFKRTVEDSIPTMIYLKESVHKFSRATTKLNKSKKSLVKTLENFVVHQQESADLLQNSLNMLLKLALKEKA